MEQIKGMLVDDEVHILRNLRTVLPWETLGVNIVGMAKNGKEALDIFHEQRPELILCDIRMPVMDGLGFVRQINKENAPCEIVMLTGYKDFEYMRSSIRSGVRDYLLKPIDYDELRNVVERIVSDIRMKQLEKEKLRDIARLTDEMISGLKKGDWNRIKQSLIHVKQDLQAVSGQSFIHVDEMLHGLSFQLLREIKQLGVINDAEEKAIYKEMKQAESNEAWMRVTEQLVNRGMEAFQKKKGDVLMMAAKDYIDRNLGENFGIHEIAEYLQISPSYFSMLFKQYFHETFVEYLTRRRMEKAEALMKTTNLSIAKIAKRLGYSDRRYFSKVFHKYRGTVPSEYREKHISKGNL